MERSTKLFLLVWACAALAAELWLLRGWGLTRVAAGAFLLGVALAGIDRRAIAAVLLFIYVFPAAIFLYHGVYYPQFGTLWMAALLGALLPDGVRTAWHVPGRWRGALVCWALIVAAGAPIVAAREIDFNPALLFGPVTPNSVLGSLPSAEISFTLHVALVLVLGILWFDWLCGQRDLDFRRFVAAPMLVSCLVMAAVAIYQLFGDIRFLNGTTYGNIGRASGTLFDANVCGTIAALWIGGGALWNRQAGRRGAIYMLALALPLWLAVWATGSRTAFGAAVVTSAFSVIAFYAAGRHAHAPVRRLMVPALAAAGVLVALLAALAVSDLGAVGPLGRVWNTLPGLSMESFRSFAAEMWNRNGYGTVATTMIREFPLFGVGVGRFHSLIKEFVVGVSLPPDNAQNWYRHQLAEFGVIGSLAWIAFVAGFALFVLKPRPSTSAAAWAGRGALTAFALISLLGMPGQEIIAAITFWTMAFWYVSAAGVPAPPARIGTPAWLAIALVVGVYVAGTIVQAQGPLRVPVRAERLGRPYSYGFYWPESNGAGGEFRWAIRRALVILDAPARWLELTVSVNHLDVVEMPVDVRVWSDRELVLRTRLASSAPVTEYVRVPDGKARIILETSVSRVVRPGDLGGGDGRELGLMVSWRFTDDPPPAPAGR